MKEIKGQNGKMKLYEDFIVISRDTIGGFLTQGGSVGERKVFFSDITSIEYKKPTFYSNGYIKLLLPGSIDTDAKVGLFSSSSKSAKDQNTIILRASNNKASEEYDSFYNLVMENLTKVKKSKNQVLSAPISKMDELKKLGELRSTGILTEEEFLIEKEKLLKS